MMTWSSRIESIFICLCLLMTLTVFAISTNTQNKVGDAEFHRLTDASAQILHTRMQAYLQTLKGTAAFMGASPELILDRFEDYAASLELDSFLPGITGLGLIRSVPHDDLAAFVSSSRKDGQPDYTPQRLTDAAEHYLVQYIYPRSKNAQALGLDATFEPQTRTALERARNTGQAQLTRRISLVQHDVEPLGYLLILPYFDKVKSVDGKPGNTLRGDFTGWVYMPFKADNLFAQLSPSLDASYHVELFDMAKSEGSNPKGVASVFTTNTDDTPPGTFSATYRMDQFGQPWTLTYTSTAQFDSAMASHRPEVILVIGIVLTVLLMFLLRSRRMRNDALREGITMRQRQFEISEAENRAIVENDAIAIFVLDEDSMVLFANRAAQVRFGYEAEGLAGRRFTDIVSDLETDTDVAGYNAHGHAQNGDTLFLDLQKNRWKAIDGQIRTTAIVRDLTGEIAAHSALKHAKSLYDMALQSAQIGVFALDLKTGRSEASKTWWLIMGFDDNDGAVATEDVFYKRVHPDDLGALTAAEQACIDGKIDCSVNEYRVRTGKGEWRWMRSHATVVARDADGTAVRMVGTQSDVTDLLRTRTALEESEQRFRDVLDMAPIGTAVFNSQGVFINVNQAFCTLCGLRDDELIGHKRLTDCVAKEDLKQVYIGVGELTKQSSRSAYVAEHRLIHADGTERWGILNVSWAYDENIGDNVFIAQVIDITEQKRLARMKDEFVATVSHELRTPLTSIKGALGLIKVSKGKSWTPEVSRLIDIAKSNTERLVCIVNDILDLEKISAGEVEFQFAKVDIGALVSACAREISPFAATHGNRLKVEVPTAPLHIHADAGRFKQVMANLMSNACKYSSSDTVVEVRVEQLDDKSIVFVQNIGPGIPEAFRPRIFQAFTQADSSDSRAKGGTGLGLNIARQIVKRHGGDIGFESQPNGITVFWCTFPIVIDEKTADLPQKTAILSPKFCV